MDRAAGGGDALELALVRAAEAHADGDLVLGGYEALDLCLLRETESRRYRRRGNVSMNVGDDREAASVNGSVFHYS
jgi:hypothetical protein